jgi:hypothetical protein
MWQRYCEVILASLAMESVDGTKLPPPLPVAWASLLSTCALLLNNGMAKMHQAVVNFVYRSQRFGNCWTTFAPFLMFYNSLDTSGGPEVRAKSRKFMLDVCARAATDVRTFDKEHFLKIVLGSFSFSKSSCFTFLCPLADSKI